MSGQSPSRSNGDVPIYGLRTADGRSLTDELRKTALLLDSEKCNAAARVVEEAAQALDTARDAGLEDAARYCEYSATCSERMKLMPLAVAQRCMAEMLRSMKSGKADGE